MAGKIAFGVSLMTNRIYYGVQDISSQMWVGQKTDVTGDCIRAVFEWFMGNMVDKEEYCITFDSTNYELVMRKKKEQ